MGMSVGGGDEGDPMVEMNTTPLIDVMLVLLIMFIITLPKPTHAVKVDLPTSCEPNCPPKPPVEPTFNVVNIYQDSSVAWNGTPISRADLQKNLQDSTLLKPIPELRFQPDQYAPYDAVSKVMAIIRASGVEAIGFVGNEQYTNSF
jgi:biopolymer transport protein ExbD